MKNRAHLIVIYPYIPVTPQHRYAVWSGVPKPKTVAVPMLGIYTPNN